MTKYQRAFTIERKVIIVQDKFAILRKSSRTWMIYNLPLIFAFCFKKVSSEQAFMYLVNTLITFEKEVALLRKSYGKCKIIE